MFLIIFEVTELYIAWSSCERKWKSTPTSVTYFKFKRLVSFMDSAFIIGE